MLWEDNYLAHYGIKGQKWGVRRFQNPDGSLTEDGKKRYETEGERDKKAKSGEHDNDLKSREAQRKIPSGLNDKERKLAESILNGKIVDNEEIYDMARDYHERNRDNTKNYGEQKLTENFIYDHLEGINQQNKYMKEIEHENDPQFIDPSYRKFGSKEDKAKAELDYLNMAVGNEPFQNTLNENPKCGREIEHLCGRVWKLSMNGYEGTPNSERTRKLFNYNGDKHEYDRLWEPKYKQSKEYKELQAKKEELKESTGFNKADRDMRGQPAKGIFAGLKDLKIFDSYDKAYKKYKEALKNSKISDSEKAMEKAFEQKVCKSVLLDLGYEVNPQNIDLIQYIIWFD